MIGSETAGGEHAMNMGVKLQSLVPGVQHAEEADLRAQMTGIAGDLEQRCSTGVKQQVVDHLLVLQGQWRQFTRQREDHVDVASGQQLPFPRLRAIAGGRCPGIVGNGDCRTSCRRWRHGRSLSSDRDVRRAQPCGSERWPAEPCDAAR